MTSDFVFSPPRAAAVTAPPSRKHRAEGGHPLASIVCSKIINGSISICKMVSHMQMFSTKLNTKGTLHIDLEHQPYIPKKDACSLITITMARA